jgi:hypothetical protein
MANEQNLIPNSERSPKEVRENGKKGGVASGIARREKKTLRELAEMLGQTKVSDKAVIEKLEALGLDKESFTHDMAIILKQYELAEKDDQKSTSAAQFIRDTKGESPKNTEFNINADVKSITINFGGKPPVEGNDLS